MARNPNMRISNRHALPTSLILSLFVSLKSWCGENVMGVLSDAGTVVKGNSKGPDRISATGARRRQAQTLAYSWPQS